MANSYYTLKWEKGLLSLIDQRLLPKREVYRTYKDYKSVVKAIKTMVVRGAPAIGVAAGYGIALGISRLKGNPKNLKAKFKKIVKDFLNSRPTAVNIKYAADRMTRAFNQNGYRSLKAIKSALIEEAQNIHNDDLSMNRTLSSTGQKLIKSGYTVLTHCNTGPLATSGYGTALGVIIAAKENGKKIKVLAGETRPRLQGARLTAWELIKNRMDASLITDNTAGHCMKKGLVDLVITGADRIAANGDSANKIGTYSLAVLAKHHKIPFYIAAPTSTIDPGCPNGSKIPIEERDSNEITVIDGKRVAPKGIKTHNFAFDVTPAKYIRGIITEKGILRPPYKKSIKKLF